MHDPGSGRGFILWRQQMDWTQLIWAAVLIMLAVYMFPRAVHWMKHGPRGDSADWRAAMIPIAMVIGFVFLLILMVRS